VSGAVIELTPDEDVTMELHIGEGLESCLSAHVLVLRPVWAFSSADAIARFPVLGGIESLTFLGETDDEGQNRRRHEALRASLAISHRRALHHHAQISKFPSDFNDVLGKVK
jgi:hypothetical protein